jgi:hypothetical protein
MGTAGWHWKPAHFLGRSFALICVLVSMSASAQADLEDVHSAGAQRPTILFNRWQEDWSVLADPDVPREPFDKFKYLPLSTYDPKTYLSFGLNLRERIESNDAATFGLAGNHSDTYLLSRFEVFADLRIADQLQLFTMLASDFASNKSPLLPVDQDRLGLELAFAALTEPLGDGVLKVRIGRQQFSFDQQRFVAVRDGENVRQSYDALWGDYETGAWRLISFYSQPVMNRDLGSFDDYSSSHLTYGGLRVERHLSDTSSASFYYSQYRKDGASYITVQGDETRNIYDGHLNGHLGPWDWDVEGMGQFGEIGEDKIRAWAFGSLFGYTIADTPWRPRLGLQIDAASGNQNPHGHELNTFNPLFPNGYYVTLAGYTGYVNFIHVKPSVTLHPTKSIKLLLAAAAQWRQTTADAVYTQPITPVPNTAGHGGSYTGAYAQGRIDWSLTPHYSFTLEAVHFRIGSALAAAGAHDSNYLGVELRYGW